MYTSANMRDYPKKSLFTTFWEENKINWNEIIFIEVGQFIWGKKLLQNNKLWNLRKQIWLMLCTEVNPLVFAITLLDWSLLITQFNVCSLAVLWNCAYFLNTWSIVSSCTECVQLDKVTWIFNHQQIFAFILFSYEGMKRHVRKVYEGEISVLSKCCILNV